VIRHSPPRGPPLHCSSTSTRFFFPASAANPQLQEQGSDSFFQSTSTEPFTSEEHHQQQDRTNTELIRTSWGGTNRPHDDRRVRRAPDTTSSPLLLAQRDIHPSGTYTRLNNLAPAQLGEINSSTALLTLSRCCSRSASRRVAILQPSVAPSQA
jgi:hypothetical protein